MRFDVRLTPTRSHMLVDVPLPSDFIFRVVNRMLRLQWMLLILCVSADPRAEVDAEHAATICGIPSQKSKLCPARQCSWSFATLAASGNVAFSYFEPLLGTLRA